MTNEHFNTLEHVMHKQRMTNAITYLVINLIAALAILFSIGVALDTAFAAPTTTAVIIEKTDATTTSSITPLQEDQGKTAHAQPREPKYTNAMLALGIIAGGAIVGIGGMIRSNRENR